MKLQEKYRKPIPEGYAVEYPEGSGVWHIPIYRIKELLGMEFESYKTKKFHFEYLQHGHECILSGSIVLVVVDAECGKHSFTGGANFNIKNYKSNQHFIATLESECIKNAAKKIGEFFGMSLNQDRLDIQTLQRIEQGDFSDKSTKKPKPSVAKAVNDIIKKQTQ